MINGLKRQQLLYGINASEYTRKHLMKAALGIIWAVGIDLSDFELEQINMIPVSELPFVQKSRMNSLFNVFRKGIGQEHAREWPGGTFPSKPAVTVRARANTR